MTLLTGGGAARLLDALVTARLGRATFLHRKPHVVLVAECLVEDLLQHGRVVRADETVGGRLQRLRECSLRHTHHSLVRHT